VVHTLLSHFDLESRELHLSPSSHHGQIIEISIGSEPKQGIDVVLHSPPGSNFPYFYVNGEGKNKTTYLTRENPHLSK